MTASPSAARGQPLPHRAADPAQPDHAAASILADDLLVGVDEDPPPPARRPRHPLLVAGAIVLVALNLRPALSSVGPVLQEMVGELAISATLASVLTTLPVLCLGLFGLSAPGLARRFGSERVILAILLVLAAGIGLRAVPSFPAQMVAAVLAGAGIGIIGALLPGLVKRDFPDRAALMTGVYTMALCAGAAVAAGAAVPLEVAFGDRWNLSLAVWLLPAVVAAAVWFPLLPPRLPAGTPPAPRVRGLWGDGLAWQVTLFMGLQSSLAYILFAWLPVILRDRGVAPVDAGFVMSVQILVQVGAALVAPLLAARFRNQSLIAAATQAISLAGFLGCVYGPLDQLWGWAVLLGIGQGASFAVALTLIVMRAGDPHVAAQLSGMAQSVGYTLAAMGPLAAGLLHDRTGAWHASTGLFVCAGLSAALFGLAAGRARLVLEGGQGEGRRG
ncbi:CynX/NimT family MFS transporter [Azospirillum thermophilum]|uniref:Cyanate transporter n=1 Tax=Azospirillum thermophilum TaxID=2202148 RepID=A0A2S2CV91_9PROT|nr:MFS transporter [Azospirillum thermophilum]AWK88433.1 cyanate transporter [Azospirillum thermophilum]